MDSSTATLPAVIEATVELNDMARAVARGLPVSESIAHDMTRAEALGDFGDERWAAAMPTGYSLRPEFKAELRDEPLRRQLHAFHELTTSLGADDGKLAAAATVLDGLREVQLKS